MTEPFEITVSAAELEISGTECKEEDDDPGGETFPSEEVAEPEGLIEERGCASVGQERASHCQDARLEFCL